MLVYGDRDQIVSTDRFVASLLDRARRLPVRAGTISEREATTRVLLDSGRLTQGLLDDAFAARGRCDGWTALEKACGELLVACGRALLGLETDVPRALAAVRTLPHSPTLRLREPEGFAFYALHPEQYAAAAWKFRAKHHDPVVVLGLRSIGTTLAGVVAAALESTLPPITLRPTGPVFDRHLRLSPGLEEELVSQRHARFAVVDEGPGLSGSSFNAVAAWLESKGVPRERIHFFPSHANGPGSESPEHVRARWNDIAVHHEPFETSVLDSVLPRESRVDLSGGLWRRLRPDLEDAGVDPARERRKYLVDLDGIRTLARFAGLGETGERKAERAKALSEAGFVPRFRGLRHGFLFEEWCDATKANVPPEHLLRYLDFRARTFPTAREAGASVAGLWTMVRQNASEAGFDPGLLATFERSLPAIEEARRPVAIDGRLHAWEWLRTRTGDLRKADAHDHAEAHDCIGAQDIAWDVAGAVVECGAPLAAFASLAPDPLPESWFSFHLVAYAAFQLGLWTNVGDSRQVARYRSALARFLEAPPGC